MAVNRMERLADVSEDLGIMSNLSDGIKGQNKLTQKNLAGIIIGNLMKPGAMNLNDRLMTLAEDLERISNLSCEIIDIVAVSLAVVEECMQLVKAEERNENEP